jgi:hypothetical protein
MLNRLQGIFASLHRHNVKYVVIGGIAAVLHGVPRATNVSGSITSWGGNEW